MRPREFRARLTFLGEAFAAGDTSTALAVVHDLLDELEPARPATRCPECGLRAWPGELPKHLSVVHGVDPFAEAA